MPDFESPISDSTPSARPPSFKGAGRIQRIQSIAAKWAFRLAMTIFVSIAMIFIVVAAQH